MKTELLAKIRKQQGVKNHPVWHCGEHLLEFLEAHPQYEDVVSTDLDNPEMTLEKFERKIHSAAKTNGGGLGGKAADAVLRTFFGLPETDAPAPVQTTAPIPVQAEDAGPVFDFSAVLL